MFPSFFPRIFILTAITPSGFRCSFTSVKKKLAIGILCFAVCCGTGHSDSFAFWETNLSYEGESVYNYLQVKEDDGQVILSPMVFEAFNIPTVFPLSSKLSTVYFTKDGVTVPSKNSGKTKIAIQARNPARIKKLLLTV